MQTKTLKYWQIHSWTFSEIIFDKIKSFNYKSIKWIDTLIISTVETDQYWSKVTIEIPHNIVKKPLINQASKCKKLIIQVKQDHVTSLKRF